MLNPIQQHNLGNAHSARNPSVTTLSITFALISTTKNTICPHCKRPLVLCSRALGLMVGRWSASGDAARGMSGRKRIDLIVQLLGGDGSTNTIYTQRFLPLVLPFTHISSSHHSMSRPTPSRDTARAPPLHNSPLLQISSLV